MSTDRHEELCTQVQAAAAAGESLAITAGGTRGFQCSPVQGGRPLGLAGYTGIVDYQPTELVLTARSGTPLTELETELAAAGQMLPFEPPRFGAAGTIGGAVAMGASGPRRPWAGSLRDCVLGVRVINGKGEAMRFGGRVMKNVAGYDVARLMVGARGTLGVLTEISLKVWPLPEREHTCRLALDHRKVLPQLAAWGRTSMPLSAAAWEQGVLRVRLAGDERTVLSAARRVGGEEDTAGEAYWRSVRDLSHPLLRADTPTLWRMVVPPAAALHTADAILVDWGGAQRWLQSDWDTRRICTLATEMGGYAMRVRAAAPPPVPQELHALYRNLKHAFDPKAVLNPGVMGVC